jgi:hypothetical protein
MAGLAEPRAPELRAMKDMLADLRQSRDDWNAQAEIRQLRQRIDAKLEGKRDVYARSVAGLQSRTAEIHCARPVDPLIAHDFEAESLALIQAGDSCVPMLSPLGQGRGHCQSNGWSSARGATRPPLGRTFKPRGLATRPRQQSVSACRLAGRLDGALD